MECDCKTSAYQQHSFSKDKEPCPGWDSNPRHSAVSAGRAQRTTHKATKAQNPLCLCKLMTVALMARGTAGGRMTQQLYSLGGGNCKGGGVESTR